MNLKNPDLFRTWLIRQLEPICKANPEPVSKYVCALLKKEKSDDELRASLVSQLDIFLDSVTEEFVTFLVDVLKEEKYMTNDANFRGADAPKSPEPEDQVELQIEAKMEETPEKEKGDERKSPSPIQPPTPSPPRKTTRSFSPRPRRSNFRNERRRPATRRSRRDASHSPSPSGERRQAQRKRSASGSSESSNKSPRRSWIASRSSDTAAKKYKHHHFSRISPPGARSRSPSPLRLHRKRPPATNFRKRPPKPIAQRSNSDNDRNHSPVKRAPPSFADIPELPAAMIAKADLPVDAPPPRIPFGPQKQRCVDFESKGYCARGDMCPFDHGPSPIVLDNNLLNGIVPLPPPPMHHPNSFADPLAYTPQFVNAPPSVFAPSKPFRPDMQHSMPPGVSNRELISVPTVPLPPKGKNAHYAGKPAYGHVFSSLPPGVSQTTIELTNVPAELNNIPDLYDNFSTFGALTLIQAKRNNDAGTALLTFSNATEAALAFINVDSTALPNAKPAWYADKCIMTPYPRKSIPAGGLPNSAKSYVINRKVPPAPAPAAPPIASSVAPAADISGPSSPPSGAVPKMAAEKPKVQASPNAATMDEKARQANEKMRQDPGRLLSDLIKKKRELLEKQLASRKEIVEKMKSLEAGGKDEKMWQDILRKLNDVIADNENSIKVSLQQRKEYLQKMNIVPMDSAALNNMRTKQVASAPVISAPSTPPIETQHQAVSSASKPDQVESTEAELGDSLDDNIFGTEEDFSLLDDELDDDEDEDEVESTTSAAPAKSSQSAGAADTSSSSVGKSASSTGAPATPEYTRVVVSGFENGDEDDLLQHFSKFGAILDKEFDPTIPSATLVYDNRKAAEEAKKEGRNFQDRLLSVNVFNSKKFPPFTRRLTTSAAFKPQEYVPYASFAPAPTGGNPYKYKNPQISAAPPAPRISGHRSVYSFRAENKARLVSAQPSFVGRAAADALKFVDEDALLSDDNLMENSD